MSTLTKIIFLTNNEKNNGMGVLKLQSKNNNIFGTLKTYQNNLNGEYLLGIKIDDRIIKQNVNLVDNNYSFIISDKIDISSPTGCVLLKKDGNEITPIIWGNEKNQNYKSCIISRLRESVQKLSSTNSQQRTFSQKEDVKNTLLSNTKEVTQLQKNNLLEKIYNNQESLKKCNSKLIIPADEITTQTYQNLNSLSCQHSNYYNLGNMGYENVYTPIKSAEYKDIGYSQISLEPEPTYNPINIQSNEIAVATAHANLFEDSEDEIQKIIDKEINISSHKFYDMIAEQLDEIFDNYPKEENLMKIIDNSKWVKIDSDYDNKHYVVGIIYQNDDIKYICYGVPGTYNNEPPVEMRNYSQWFPTDVKNPYNTGYWVMYQDAETGENIFIN